MSHATFDLDDPAGREGLLALCEARRSDPLYRGLLVEVSRDETLPGNTVRVEGARMRVSPLAYADFEGYARQLGRAGRDINSN